MNEHLTSVYNSCTGGKTLRFGDHLVSAKGVQKDCAAVVIGPTKCYRGRRLLLDWTFPSSTISVVEISVSCVTRMEWLKCRLLFGIEIQVFVAAEQQPQ